MLLTPPNGAFISPPGTYTALGPRQNCGRWVEMRSSHSFRRPCTLALATPCPHLHIELVPTAFGAFFAISCSSRSFRGVSLSILLLFFFFRVSNSSHSFLLCRSRPTRNALLLSPRRSHRCAARHRPGPTFRQSRTSDYACCQDQGQDLQRLELWSQG